MVYRKNRLLPGFKLYQAYVSHEDFYLKDITQVTQKKSGAVVVSGEIAVLRKQHGVEAISRQWIISRLIIPPYYEDLGSIARKLKSLAAS